jgi:hypothetical protein
MAKSSIEERLKRIEDYNAENKKMLDAIMTKLNIPLCPNKEKEKVSSDDTSQ